MDPKKLLMQNYAFKVVVVIAAFGVAQKDYFSIGCKDLIKLGCQLPRCPERRFKGCENLNDPEPIVEYDFQVNKKRNAFRRQRCLENPIFCRLGIWIDMAEKGKFQVDKLKVFQDKVFLSKKNELPKNFA